MYLKEKLIYHIIADALKNKKPVEACPQEFTVFWNPLINVLQRFGMKSALPLNMRYGLMVFMQVSVYWFRLI